MIFSLNIKRIDQKSLNLFHACIVINLMVMGHGRYLNPYLCLEATIFGYDSGGEE